MAITKGRGIEDIAADVSIRLSDPNQRRWSNTLLISYMNEAIRTLARKNAFFRYDIHVPTVGQEFYETFAESMTIKKVEYDNEPIHPQNIDSMERDFGTQWRTEPAGTPRFYIPQRNGIILWPKPDTAGTALVYTGSPAITEETGGKINGDGYTGGNSSGTIVHFLPGDGEVSNENADNNLRIRYQYMPRASESGDSVPGRYEEALKAYAMWQAVAVADAPEEKVAATTFFQNWLMEKRNVLGLSHDDATALDLIAGAMEAT